MKMTTTPDEHPDDHLDDLVDRLAAGGHLSRSEHAFLATHLRQCDVCSFLQSVKADLRRDEGTGPDRASVAMLVASTLASAATSTALAARTGARSQSGARVAVFRAAVAMAACLLLGLGGFALAGYWKNPAVPKPTAAALDFGAVPAAVQTSLPPATNAADLFARARDARLRGAADTRQLYQMLWQRFASTPEGQAGRAIFGRWLLDRGEPAAALPVFADYLRVAPAGALEEEARVGTAESWEKLGRTREARTAWEALLTQHPGSAHALRARDRLRVLEGEPQDLSSRPAGQQGP